MVRLATLLKKVPRRHRGPLARRPEHRAAADGHPWPRAHHDGQPVALLERVAASAAGGRGRPLPRRRRLHAGDQRYLFELLPDRHLPGPDAAGVRPRPSVPVHLEPEQEPRRGREARRADQVRARQGAGHAAALRAGAGEHRAEGRPDLRVPRRRHRAQHPRAVPGHGGARRASLPHHPRHRHGDPGGRGRRPARDRRSRAEAAALRRAVAARGRRDDAAPRPQHPGRELRRRGGRRGPDRGSHGPRRLARDSEAAPPAAEGPDVLAAPAVGRQRPRDDLRPDPLPGPPGAPPVRFVRRRRVVPARRDRRPAGGRHQDDALPDRPELAAGRSADRRRRTGQAGGACSSS